MRVLIAYASKHGATEEIADVIAQDMMSAGLNVDLRRASTVESISSYDAVIIGSAIYMGQWQPDAMSLIDTFESALKEKNVWLFSSGPIGEDPFPKDEPPVTEQLLERTGAHEHQSFTGRLDKSTLGFGERIITAAVRAPEGDFRDWDAIRAWARHVATMVIQPDRAVTAPVE
jgi:menaquinone-dependent protoporphyrinogen oxidase